MKLTNVEMSPAPFQNIAETICHLQADLHKWKVRGSFYGKQHSHRVGTWVMKTQIQQVLSNQLLITRSRNLSLLLIPPELPPIPAQPISTRILLFITYFKKRGFYEQVCPVKSSCVSSTMNSGINIVHQINAAALSITNV